MNSDKLLKMWNITLRWRAPLFAVVEPVELGERVSRRVFGAVNIAVAANMASVRLWTNTDRQIRLRRSVARLALPLLAGPSAVLVSVFVQNCERPIRCER